MNDNKYSFRHQQITGLILSGGRGSRAGGSDKGLLKWKGKMLIERQIEWMASQTVDFMISANRNLEVYKIFDIPVISDESKEPEGPLRGIESGLHHLSNDWLFVVPVDVPMLPDKLLAQIVLKINNAPTEDTVAYYVASNERSHYLCLLIHKCCLPKLKQYLTGEDRRVRGFLAEIKATKLLMDYPESCFANFNQLADFDE